MSSKGPYRSFISPTFSFTDEETVCLMTSEGCSTGPPMPTHPYFTQTPDKVWEAHMPRSLTLHLLQETRHSQPTPSSGSVGFTALPESLFLSSPSFGGNCEPHMSPTASICRRELERSGAHRTLGNNATMMSRQSLYKHPGQSMNVPGAPALCPALADQEITHLGS